eukprot:SAG31_NODE_17478_length_669_cov_0.905263_2_plen_53_part_01
MLNLGVSKGRAQGCLERDTNNAGAATRTDQSIAVKTASADTAATGFAVRIWAA